MNSTSRKGTLSRNELISSRGSATEYYGRDHANLVHNAYLNSELNSASLFNLKPKHEKTRNSDRKDSADRKRPQSSRIKRSQISTTASKPVVEGEIMLRVSVAITDESSCVVNVYKGDTAYTVADRCISQHLNKMKVRTESSWCLIGPSHYQAEGRHRFEEEAGSVRSREDQLR